MDHSPECQPGLSVQLFTKCIQAFRPTLVAQLAAPSDCRPGGRGFNPCRGRQLSFVEIDHEIFSTVILPSADSRRAVVSFWRNNVHNTG